MSQLYLVKPFWLRPKLSITPSLLLVELLIRFLELIVNEKNATDSKPKGNFPILHFPFARHTEITTSKALFDNYTNVYDFSCPFSSYFVCVKFSSISTVSMLDEIMITIITSSIFVSISLQYKPAHPSYL